MKTDKVFLNQLTTLIANNPVEGWPALNLVGDTLITSTDGSYTRSLTWDYSTLLDEDEHEDEIDTLGIALLNVLREEGNYIRQGNNHMVMEPGTHNMAILTFTDSSIKFYYSFTNL